MHHWSCIHVERKILERIVIGKTAALPSRRGARLYDEQGNSPTMFTSSRQQTTQNFFLCGAGVNVGNVSQQRVGIAIRACRRGSDRRRSGQRLEHSLHELGLQRRDLAGESLLHRAFNDLD